MLNFYLSLLETDEQKDIIRELYTNYEQVMYKIAFSILHNRHDSEDAVHEAFLTIIQNIDKFSLKTVPKMAPLLVIIIRNISINKLHKRSYVIPLETMDNQPAEDPFESLDSEKPEQILKALKQLTNEQKEIIYLKFIADIPTPAIAKLLNITDSAVRKRIRNARRRLSECLGTEKEVKDEGKIL